MVSLIAFGAGLTETWRLNFENLDSPTDGIGPPPIAGDGALYFVGVKKDSTGQLIAVQTSSPGLAATAWPRADGNGNGNGGAGWTVP